MNLNDDTIALKPKRQTRIACKRSGQIVLGVSSIDGLRITREIRDVTSECLKAVIDKIGEGNIATVSVDGAPHYEVSVRRIEEPVVILPDLTEVKRKRSVAPRLQTVIHAALRLALEAETVCTLRGEHKSIDAMYASLKAFGDAYDRWIHR
jgi:hypothetical protein